MQESNRRLAGKQHRLAGKQQQACRKGAGVETAVEQLQARDYCP
jgi:hypothetical protein